MLGNRLVQSIIKGPQRRHKVGLQRWKETQPTGRLRKDFTNEADFRRALKGAEISKD